MKFYAEELIEIITQFSNLQLQNIPGQEVRAAVPRGRRAGLPLCQVPAGGARPPRPLAPGIPHIRTEVFNIINFI